MHVCVCQCLCVCVSACVFSAWVFIVFEWVCVCMCLCVCVCVLFNILKYMNVPKQLYYRMPGSNKHHYGRNIINWLYFDEDTCLWRICISSFISPVTYYTHGYKLVWYVGFIMFTKTYSCLSLEMFSKMVGSGILRGRFSIFLSMKFKAWKYNWKYYVIIMIIEQSYQTHDILCWACFNTMRWGK